MIVRVPEASGITQMLRESAYQGKEVNNMNQNPPALPVCDRTPHREALRITRMGTGQIPEIIRRHCAPCDAEQYGKGVHTLWFLPEAGVELEHVTGFGRKRARNAYELTYLGLGHRFVEDGGKIQTVVTRVLPIYSASRGPTHAQVVSEGNDAMLDILERERQIQNELEKTYNTDENGFAIDPFLEYGPSEVVLFGHTHPDLGCFFSPTDHRSNYSTPSVPMVTFVCDPIRKDMKAMVGVKGENVRVMVCHPRNQTASQRSPASRQCTVEDLWRKVSAMANILLRQAGIKGSFDCYHDWKGNSHMEFHIIYRPPKGTQQH